VAVRLAYPPREAGPPRPRMVSHTPHVVAFRVKVSPNAGAVGTGRPVNARRAVAWRPWRSAQPARDQAARAAAVKCAGGFCMNATSCMIEYG